MIRRLEKKDRNDLIEVLDTINIFSTEEKKTAIELIDETLENDLKDDYSYNIFIYEFDKKVVGYHCIGKRYMTTGTYDLYWIVVDSRMHGKGIGKELLQHAENFIREQKGYLVIAETSSQPSYELTRKFYHSNDYEVLADIKDFYKVNDNLIIFGKYLTT
ncbi:MAG: GNAT family N-acetyltransferase [Melioribacteraceae bacterium]|nr:GNAT family N-acetyltransferase [Melioribacteraceae bacterium]WKZ68615.1 MAG: GNAT family N-acetyltransferase [Melioribacteraceae bacterium]